MSAGNRREGRENAGSADLSDEACFYYRMIANGWRSRIAPRTPCDTGVQPSRIVIGEK